MKSNRVFYIGLVCVLAILLWTIGRWVEKRESTELRGSRRGSLANPDVNLSSTQSILSIPNKTEDITFELTKPLRTCFKKKKTPQELMFTFNHWSSPY